MILMIVPGIISLVFGVLFFCAPQLLNRQRTKTSSWIETDTFFLHHRVSAGLCLITVGLFCLSSAVYVWLRLHAY